MATTREQLQPLMSRDDIFDLFPNDLDLPTEIVHFRSGGHTFMSLGLYPNRTYKVVTYTFHDDQSAEEHEAHQRLLACVEALGAQLRTTPSIW